jgi:hypothetical protein
MSLAPLRRPGASALTSRLFAFALLQHEGGREGRVAAGLPRHHQLRPRLHRQVRHPGQLQRPGGVGHLQPVKPVLVVAFNCPASQNDVSVYKNLMFMSAEAKNGRSTAAPSGVPDTVSKDRMRGVRIFDISDIANPKLVGNVQTCRGSHTHTVVEDPKDKDNIYIYVSGSSGVRSRDELAGACARRRTRTRTPRSPHRDHQGPARTPGAVRRREPGQHLRRPRRQRGRTAPSDADKEAAEAMLAARAARGAFTTRSRRRGDRPPATSSRRCMLDSIVKARGGTGAPTGADSGRAAPALQNMINRCLRGGAAAPGGDGPGARSAMTSRSIPHSGSPAAPARATASCSTSATRPTRVVSTRWPTRTSPTGTRPRSTTTAPSCSSPTSGAEAAAQVPRRRQDGVGRGRDLHDRERQAGVPELLQDPDRADVDGELRRAQRLAHPDPGPRRDGAGVVPGRHLGLRLDRREEPEGDRLFDRGPVDSTRMAMGGSWSVYWYNGAIVSSEIARGSTSPS